MKPTVNVWIAIAAVFFTGVAGQSPSNCSKSALSDAAVEQLDMYDKDLFIDPNCVDPTTPLPVHCNYMGLGQECRGCFLTCDGAEDYVEDFPEEYAAWGDAIITFCPGTGIEDFGDC